MLLGFARGVPDDTEREGFDVVDRLLRGALVLVLLGLSRVSHSFGGALGRINMGDAMLVMAFTLVGSAVQTAGRGRRVAGGSFLAYNGDFWSRK